MRSIDKMKKTMAFPALAVLLAASGAALAQDIGGKLLATGGVSTIEGAGGGGLVPWALISGYGTDRQIGANVHASGVRTGDFGLQTHGVALGIHDRVELSFGQQSFDTKDALGAIDPGLRRYKLKQDVIGIKVRVLGDAIYDQDTWLPQVAVGVQYKHNKDDKVIPFLNSTLAGFGGPAIKNHGVDFYVAATKLYLNQSLLLNGTVRFTNANQYGLLGFGGPQGDRLKPQLEASAALLLRKNLAVGVELRTKRGNLSNPALNLSEQNAADLFIAYFPSKHVSITAAYVDLGQIVGALTNNKRQSGGYLSVQVGF
jgi:hypothetical protein